MQTLGDDAMFGLPIFTVVVIGSVCAFWICYTAVFWAMSKNWHLADEIKEGEPV